MPQFLNSPFPSQNYHLIYHVCIHIYRPVYLLMPLPFVEVGGLAQLLSLMKHESSVFVLIVQTKLHCSTKIWSSRHRQF